MTLPSTVLSSTQNLIDACVAQIVEEHIELGRQYLKNTPTADQDEVAKDITSQLQDFIMSALTDCSSGALSVALNKAYGLALKDRVMNYRWNKELKKALSA